MSLLCNSKGRKYWAHLLMGGVYKSHWDFELWDGSCGSHFWIIQSVTFSLLSWPTITILGLCLIIFYLDIKASSLLSGLPAWILNLFRSILHIVGRVIYLKWKSGHNSIVPKPSRLPIEGRPSPCCTSSSWSICQSVQPIHMALSNRNQLLAVFSYASFITHASHVFCCVSSPLIASSPSTSSSR